MTTRLSRSPDRVWVRYEAGELGLGINNMRPELARLRLRCVDSPDEADQ